MKSALFGAARELFERFMEKPDFRAEDHGHDASEEGRDDLKTNDPRWTEGYRFGHETGFAKGFAIAALGAMVVVSVLRGDS